MGKNVYRCVKRSLLWPGALALLEHSLAHNVGTDALRGAANQVIDRAGLSPWSELEVLAEVLLIDDPGHQRPPLRAQFLYSGLSQFSVVIPSGRMFGSYAQRVEEECQNWHAKTGIDCASSGAARG